MKRINIDTLFYEAQIAVTEGNLGKAENILHSLLTTLQKDPRRINALYILGAVHLADENWGMAIEFTRLATEAREDFGPAWNNLGAAFSRADMVPEAIEAYEKAIGRMPDEAGGESYIYSNIAGCNLNGYNPERAVEIASKAAELDPTNAQAHWHKCLGLIELERWAEAWDLHHWRFHPACLQSSANRDYSAEKDPETPWWDFLLHGAKTTLVAIHGEQGLGDEVLFSQCLVDLLEEFKDRPVKFIVEPSPRLEATFKRSFEDSSDGQLVVYGTDETDGHEYRDELGRPKYKLGLGDLMQRYRRTPESFTRTPYLVAPHGSNGPLGRLAEGGLRVGIAWQGGHVRTLVQHRTVPFEKLGPLLKARDDIEWVSLNYHALASVECKSLEENIGVKIHHDDNVVGAGQDFDKTVGLVSTCDLVITVPQSLWHLCGALGKECWTLTPKKHGWRQPYKGLHSPWYGDHIKLIHQKEDGKWDQVLQTALDWLKAYDVAEAA